MRGAICRDGCRYWRGWSLSQCGRARLSSCKLLSVALCVVQLLSLAECLLALYIDLGVGFGILMCRNLVLRSRGNRERVLCVFQVAGLRGGRVEADQRARVSACCQLTERRVCNSRGGHTCTDMCGRARLRSLEQRAWHLILTFLAAKAQRSQPSLYFGDSFLAFLFQLQFCCT